MGVSDHADHRFRHARHSRSPLKGLADNR